MFSPDEIRSKIEYIRGAGEYFRAFAEYRVEDLEGNINGINAIRKVLFISLEDINYIVLHISSEQGSRGVSNIENAYKSMVGAQIFPSDLCEALKLILPYKNVILRSPKVDLAEFLQYVSAMPDICAGVYQFIHNYLKRVAPGK